MEYRGAWGNSDKMADLFFRFEIATNQQPAAFHLINATLHDTEPEMPWDENFGVDDRVVMA